MALAILLSMTTQTTKKTITKAETEAMEWSKDSDNQYGVAWVIQDGNKIIVTANSNNEKGKIISKWVGGYKEVCGILMRYSK